MIKELQRVILTVDIPDHKLLKGDIGTVVMVHTAELGYEVEFSTLYGDTIVVATLSANQVRSVNENEIAHVRNLVNI
ncbi:MAG: DUF4926 domain-containing protein [Bacteroidia bacterium]|nr:DUF4926 domain-containing protein [Bacteroidia bacterium]